MPVTEIGDPRLQALFGASDPRDAGVRPTIRLPRSGLPSAALAALAVVFGVLLFMVLNERRTAQSEPRVNARPASAATVWTEPPPLYVPPQPDEVKEPEPVVEQRPVPQPLAAPTPVAPRPLPVRTVYLPQPLPRSLAPFPAPQARPSGGAPLVIDTSAPPGASEVHGPANSASGETVTRIRASALANRSSTIPKGTLIQAVLETGFNSTQPGFARAVVSRDVRSFDGTNVLIPRGSKLTGEYHSDVAQGQKRALIRWTRLIRPDGMMITIDSPAVDTLGRGGVAASVNTHFFARLGDSLLQTIIGVGTGLAQRSVTGPVVVLPSNVTAATGQVATANSYVPTLTVPAGKSISIFVAHDLDFSAAATPR